jgi:hypothetical protein
MDLAKSDRIFANITMAGIVEINTFEGKKLTITVDTDNIDEIMRQVMIHVGHNPKTHHRMVSKGKRVTTKKASNIDGGIVHLIVYDE